MTVLVVDDRISVVSGIVSGIDWEALEVDKVLTAYNAFDAEELLHSQMVEILLCDIEMPVRNGISLLRRIRSQGIETECIFLTSHAEFPYIKEAMQLGSVDYILQPARYEDIQASLKKAVEKIQVQVEEEQYSRYGKMFFQHRELIVDSFLRDWYSGVSVRMEPIFTGFTQLEVPVKEDTEVCFVLLSLLQWNGEGRGWEEQMLRYALTNIIAELFSRYGQEHLSAQLEAGQYGFLVYPFKEVALLPHEALEQQLSRLVEICDKHLDYSAACYVGGPVVAAGITDLSTLLHNMHNDNVELKTGVFFARDEVVRTTDASGLSFIRRWSGHLLKGNFRVVEVEAAQYLEQSGQTFESLRLFYQDLLQAVYHAAEKLEISAHELASGQGLAELERTACSSIPDMQRFISQLLSRFEDLVGQGQEQKSQIERIIQYIHENMEKELTRTEIARAVHLNPDYLSRLFRQKTGASLKEFITREKIKIAQILLQTTDLPVSAVAAKVGYSNFSHFSQVYKKNTGLTPAEDRQTEAKMEKAL